jgi:hypothetical protein
MLPGMRRAPWVIRPQTSQAMIDDTGIAGW